MKRTHNGKKIPEHAGEQTIVQLLKNHETNIRPSNHHRFLQMLSRILRANGAPQ